MDDGNGEALASFRGLEQIVSWVLEYGCLDVEVEQRMELAQTFQALTVEEEVGWLWRRWWMGRCRYLAR